MFLDNVSKVINKNDSTGSKFTVYISDPHECSQIDKGKISCKQEIVAYGESKTMDLVTAEAILPKPKFIKNLLTNTTENSHLCWCCENLGVEQFVGHRTALNSWECLMVTMGNPEYVVITQEIEKKDDN